MKAKYVKPALVMERFEVTQSIAAGCSAASSSTVGDPNQWEKTTCGWDLGSTSIWTDLTEKCIIKQPEDYNLGGICYNNPEGGQTIFNS